MRLNTQDIGYINVFETTTRARVVDCFEAEGALNFIVKAGDLGIAIGKKGVNINKVKKALGKRILIIEDADNPETFLRKLCSPLTPNVSKQEDTIRIELSRTARDDMPGKRIRIIRELLKRRFKINEVSFVFV